MKAATKSHEEELKALAEVKKVIVAEKSEAKGIAYGLRQTSLLQFNQIAISPTLRLSDLCENLHESRNYQHFNSLQYEWPQLCIQAQ